MAIVMAGKQFTAVDLQNTAGHLATMIGQFVQDGMNLNGQLQSWPDADLLALGLTQDQINAIKGFFIGDLPAISQALQASAWMKQLLGLGA